MTFQRTQELTLRIVDPDAILRVDEDHEIEIKGSFDIKENTIHLYPITNNIDVIK